MKPNIKTIGYWIFTVMQFLIYLQWINLINYSYLDQKWTTGKTSAKIEYCQFSVSLNLFERVCAYKLQTSHYQPFVEHERMITTVSRHATFICPWSFIHSSSRSQVTLMMTPNFFGAHLPSCWFCISQNWL